jgi:hypothetical protein
MPHLGRRPPRCAIVPHHRDGEACAGVVRMVVGGLGRALTTLPCCHSAGASPPGSHQGLCALARASYSVVFRGNLLQPM